MGLKFLDKTSVGKPASGDIPERELVLNLKDGELYSSTDGSNVILLSSSGERGGIDWNNGSNYKKGDIVSTGSYNYAYVAQRDNTGIDPSTDDGTTWSQPSNKAGGVYTSLKNAIINAQVTRINQRRFDGDWSHLADGEYGYDRWKKSLNGMTQVVEAGNFIPDTYYTLSGENITTTTLLSPAAGTDWPIEVPRTAYNIQLELGNEQTAFEAVPYSLEHSRCNRYFRYIDYMGITSGSGENGDETRTHTLLLSPQMRAAPSLDYTWHASIGGSNSPSSHLSNAVMFLRHDANNATALCWCTDITLDAEL